MFDRIPDEMRAFNQWIVWRYEDRNSPKPTKVPYNPLNGRMASVDDFSTWATFEQACYAATTAKMYDGVGFVLTESDPYAFIDLDDAGEDSEAWEKQKRIFEEFPSYAELSPSGKGLHIIVRGRVETGRRRSKIEVYSSLRYMTMTGNVYRDAPIVDCNNMLQVLHSQMGKGPNVAQYYSGDAVAKEDDQTVIERATEAANGGKFADLYAGNWQNYYQSQSEADLALVDMVAFYTQNKTQITRIFHASGLGQRDKAKRTGYVDYMLAKCFDRMLPPIDIDGLQNKLIEHLAAAKAAALKQNSDPEGMQLPPPEPALTLASPNGSPYSVPPGLVGAVAQFIYMQAPRPVPEIALAGAIGLIAGIVGRAYNISSTGLNQYVLLLAATGNGKEAIASGIDKIMAEVAKKVPNANNFIGPAEISSAPAMVKYLAKQSASFVSLVGEFGLYLQQMSSAHASPVMLGLRRLILDLFNKSGEGKILRPTIYSDKDKNTLAVMAPAFTLLGESTPERFYEGLNESMITEGMLPRFTIIEYHGDRPEENEQHATVRPEFRLIEGMADLCSTAEALNMQHKAVKVDMTDDAKGLLKQFNKFCDVQINSADREVRRHLWNRAHIKALKLGAIVAVGCQWYKPIVTREIAQWAINIVIADVENLLKRFDAGDIGADNDETKQLQTIVKACREWVVSPWSEVEKYSKGMSSLHSQKIIPYSYLQRKLASIAVFRKDRIGSTAALRRAIATLVERGDIQQVSKATLHANHGTTTAAYMIARPSAFDL
jgi:hypothetical protein